MNKDNNEKLKSTNPNYEPRYWKRLWIVASGIATGWRLLPGVFAVAATSGKEFILDLWRVFWHLVMPLTFILAPFWLWLLERDNAKRARERKADLQRAVDGLTSLQKDTEPHQ